MDRNSAIGLTLIAVLLLVYFNFFAPEPPKEVAPAPTTQTTTDSTAQQSASPLTDLTASPTDSLALVEEKTTVVENEELIITFSSKGGVIKQVELKKFKTYYKKPLLLVSPTTNAFTLKGIVNGKDLNLYNLHYHLEDSRKSGDSTLVSFSASLGDGKSVRHTYSIPSVGYLFRYRIETTGLAGALQGDHLTLAWTDFIPPQEKDIVNSRQKTTINYFQADGSFDYLSESSLDPESEAIVNPIQWIGIKQKFFTSALIAKKPFAGGELSTSVNQADTTVVKVAQVNLYIPNSIVAGNQADFQFFFGPNDYKLLASIPIEGFSKNLDLGWPPMIWVNKFVIIPIFHFLEGFIGSYGVIIMILVIIIKLILTPLSYSSYLGMAKMRLLKPELDLIKEKNGDNMTQNQQDQMKLYQQAGVNPFSGCIPLLLQMPILIAMFYFFPVSVELRQQPFLWADDLSTYDSIISLPFTIPFYGAHVSLFVLLMTASTLIYTWQNNQITSATGPMKSMSYIMPVIFMFILNTFSAGLSFYYFVSNLVTFAQQAIIKRFVDEDKIKAVMEDHKKKMVTGTGKKSKFMTKLEEAMKASEEAKKNKGK